MTYYVQILTKTEWPAMTYWHSMHYTISRQVACNLYNELQRDNNGRSYRVLELNGKRERIILGSIAQVKPDGSLTEL